MQKVQKQLAWPEKKLGIGAQFNDLTMQEEKRGESRRADLIYLRDVRRVTVEAKGKGKKKDKQ